MALAILQNQDTFAPYSAIEKMYTALTLDKQREVFDFLCFLTAQNAAPKQKTTPKESYSAGFFDLFGIMQHAADLGWTYPENHPD